MSENQTDRKAEPITEATADSLETRGKDLAAAHEQVLKRIQAARAQLKQLEAHAIEIVGARKEIQRLLEQNVKAVAVEAATL